MKQVRTTFENHIRRSLDACRVERTDALLVAVSGGADSVALLCALRRVHRLVTAIHCNFHLRGDESDRDAAFVRNLSRDLDIKLITIDFQAHKIAEERKISIEMACRDLRYERFEEERQRLGCRFIAVAHTADDNIETMLLNMLRGSGLRGLAGMTMIRGNILRPMLSLSRTDVEAYLESLGQAYITDSSNLTTDYRRNFVRLKLLPQMESRWPGARKALRRTQENLQHDETELQALREGKGVNKDVDNELLSCERLALSASAENDIFRFFSSHGGNRNQAADAWRAYRSGNISTRWEVADGQEIVLGREGFVIRKDAIEEAAEECQPVEYHQFELTDELMKKIKSERRPDHLYIGVPSDTQIEDFMRGWRWRRPQQGDRIKPLGMRGSQLISDIVKDAHLTELQKHSVRLLVDLSGEIIWLPGLKRSRLHLVDAHSNVAIIYPPASSDPRAAK